MVIRSIIKLGTILIISCLGLTSCQKSDSSSSEVLKINGSTTVNLPAAEASEVLREKGLNIQIDTQGGSSGGISMLGEERVDIGMSSKKI